MDQKTLDLMGMTQEQWNQRVREQIRTSESASLYEAFKLFSDYAEKHRENYLEMRISRDGAGSIGRSGEPGCNEWMTWNHLDEASGKVREAIAEWEKQEKEEYGE